VVVTPDSNGVSVLTMLMKLTHLPGAPLVLSGCMATTATVATTVRPSSSSPREMEPPPKKVHSACLGVSSWYVCGAAYPLHGFCSSCLCT
jgi:hypothetical protein